MSRANLGLPERFADAETRALFERVRSYALADRPSGGTGTWFRQRGALRMRADRPWIAFRAEQTIDAANLAFRWEAKARIGRVVPVRAVDAFDRGHGVFVVRVLGLPVVRGEGADFDEGEFLRFLAELPWCPIAYDHPSLSWAVDGAGRLRVTAPVGSVRASLALEVNDRGCVIASEAMRPRRVGKKVVATRWTGRFSAYTERDGMRIPSGGEVTWWLPEGPFTYWKGEILEMKALGPSSPGT